LQALNEAASAGTVAWSWTPAMRARGAATATVSCALGTGHGTGVATGSDLMDLLLPQGIARKQRAGAFTPGFRALLPTARGRYDELRFIPWGFLDPFYAATVQATEEAVVNALVANEEMVGIHGRRSPALPRDRVVELLRERGVTRRPRRARAHDATAQLEGG
jgi:hypothetical protein